MVLGSQLYPPEQWEADVTLWMAAIEGDNEEREREREREREGGKGDKKTATERERQRDRGTEEARESAVWMTAIDDGNEEVSVHVRESISVRVA
eukprot:3298287-Rhodomonas_salina.1